MTAQLSPTPVQKFFDNNGFPAAFGTLGTFIAGTNTPQATYVDSTQTTPNTNPVVLNFRGECNLWLDPSKTYKFVLKDFLGILIWTVDNIPGGNFASNISANLIPNPTNTWTLGDATHSWANLYLGPNAAPAFDPGTGNIGYYGQTAAEIAASVVPAKFVFQPYDTRRYGAAQANSSAVNKTALQTAITVATFDVGAASLGGVVIVVPASCHYGYKTTDKTTWPQFSGTTPITVYDYSQGESYSGYPTAYDGNQVRLFSYTPQTTAPVNFTAGLSGGATSGTLNANWTNISGPWPVTFSNGDVRIVTFTNLATTATWSGGLSGASTANATYVNAGNNDADNFYWRGLWAPNIIVGNDADLSGTRIATDNRRARFLTANQGEITWAIGQGVGSSAALTSEQLSNFVIQKFAVTGDTLGAINSLLIERLTGNWMFNAGANLPGASYHFVSTVSGFAQAIFENPFSTTSQVTLRNSAGTGSDVAVVNRAGGLALNIVGQGDAVTVEKANRRVTFSTSTVDHSTAVPISGGAAASLDVATSNVFVITNSDNSSFTINAPSNPTTGQWLEITVRNTGGSTLTTTTFNAVFKLAAWGAISTATSRTIRFRYNGTNWVEIGRTPTDVPN